MPLQNKKSEKDTDTSASNQGSPAAVGIASSLRDSIRQAIQGAETFEKVLGEYNHAFGTTSSGVEYRVSRWVAPDRGFPPTYSLNFMLNGKTHTLNFDQSFNLKEKGYSGLATRMLSEMREGKVTDHSYQCDCPAGFANNKQAIEYEKTTGKKVF